MMNWVEKIAPVVPTVQAKMVGAPIAPVQAKALAGSICAMCEMPPLACIATKNRMTTPTNLISVCSTVT